MRSLDQICLLLAKHLLHLHFRICFPKFTGRDPGYFCKDPAEMALVAECQAVCDLRHRQSGKCEDAFGFIDLLLLYVFQRRTGELFFESAAEMIFAHIHMPGKCIQVKLLINMHEDIAGYNSSEAGALLGPGVDLAADAADNGADYGRYLKFIRNRGFLDSSLQGLKTGVKIISLKEKRKGMLFAQCIEHCLTGSAPEVHPQDLCMLCFAEIIFMRMAQIHQDPLSGRDQILHAILFYDQTAGECVHDQMIVKIVSVNDEILVNDTAHRVADHKSLLGIGADKWHYIIDIWKHWLAPLVPFTKSNIIQKL